jgi:hypothetical protein
METATEFPDHRQKLAIAIPVMHSRASPIYIFQFRPPLVAFLPGLQSRLAFSGRRTHTSICALKGNVEVAKVHICALKGNVEVAKVNVFVH